MRPPEQLDGPPLVTCKAWAIADGRTGEFLFGLNEDQKRDNASTTKVMTAHLVLKLANDDPKVLDEVVTFSKRADETNGSTSDIQAGESLTVGELLYGLMLPSGNDASVALAEHFGNRFPPSNDSEGKAAANDKQPQAKTDDPLDRFIAEMNREAKRLGMENTTFKNPHGLTVEGHGTSARDLTILAHAALQNEHFRHYVSTRQHSTKVTAADGSQRQVSWQNTNQLLGIKGYDGVKTGTTGAAGACLVASGRRGEDCLLVVVLGSSSTDARYVDTRNLFRWAWQQRANPKLSGAGQ